MHHAVYILGAPYLYAAALLIFILELAFGRHKGVYKRDDFYILAGCTALAMATRPLAGLLFAFLIGQISTKYAGTLASTKLVIAYPILLFVSELTFYWVHRWAHEAKNWRIDALWKLHRTHHSAAFMNVGVFMRVHPLWYFVVPQGLVCGIATYLGLGLASALVLTTNFGWNLITHANFRWDDAVRRAPMIGPAFYALEHVFVSPGIHHTHHGYGKDGANFRNFATVLSLIDWMFGTLHIPEGRPWRYGLPGRSARWAEQVIFPAGGARSSKVDVT